MILTHFSKEEMAFEPNRVYSFRRPIDPPEFAMKPNGLWLSDEASDGWKKWCEDENWGMNTLSYQKNFLCDLSKWIVLKDAQELVKFTKQYGFNPYPETITIIPYIDWDLVSKAFSGILISPYIDECRFTLHWYCGWDCASACVWDLSTVKEIERIM